MSDKTTADLTLERVNRLTLAIAGLTESQSAQGRQFLAMTQQMIGYLERVESRIAALEIRIIGLERRIGGVESGLDGIARFNHRIEQMLADIAAKLTP